MDNFNKTTQLQLDNMDNDHLLVNGIIYYSYITMPELGKTIFLFGENHSLLFNHPIPNTGMSMAIPYYKPTQDSEYSLQLLTWIELYRRMMEENGDCLNLFLELGLRDTLIDQQLISPTANSLKIIKFYYANKTRLSKKHNIRKKYLRLMPNLKVHETDFRDDMFFSKNNDVIIDINIYEELSNFLLDIVGLVMETIDYYGFIERYSYGQLDIIDPYILSRLVKQYKKSIFRYDPERFHRVLIDCILEVENIYTRGIKEQLMSKVFKNIRMAYQTIIGDIYTICRFFIIESHRKSGILRDNLIDSCANGLNDNIVYVGGMAHCVFYNIFINQYFNVVPNEEIVRDQYSNVIPVYNPGFSVKGMTISERDNILNDFK